LCRPRETGGKVESAREKGTGGKDVELERKGRKEERRWDGKRAASERLSIYPCQKVERKIFLLSSYSRENCSRKAPNPRVLSTLVILFSSSLLQTHA